MTVKELADALGMATIQSDGIGNNVSGGYTSDLLSDVMANAGDGCALITIQAHVNTVAVASLTGAAAIIICNNHSVPSDMVDKAKQECIPILQTDNDQFTASHLVYTEINKK